MRTPLRTEHSARPDHPTILTLPATTIIQTKMQILIIGGVTESLLNFRGNLIRLLLENGHIVHTAAGEFDARTVSTLTQWGVHYHRLPLERVSLSPIKDLRLSSELRRLIVEVNPDVILSYTIKPVIYGGLVSRFFGRARFIGLITGLGQTFQPTNWKQRIIYILVSNLYRTALRKADAVIVQNTSDLQVIKNTLGVPEDRVHLVNGSGVDISRFERTQLPSEKPLFLLVARLIRGKGVLEYCEVARRLRGNGINATFDLLGQFEQSPGAISREQIMSYVDDGSIRYHGSVVDVRPYFRRAHVYVFPSYYNEGLARTLLEALSIGRPIITTDHPGCREAVIDGVNGYLVKKQNIDDLEQKILKILNERDRWPEMSEASRELAESTFDVDLINQAMLKLITKHAQL